MLVENKVRPPVGMIYTSNCFGTEIVTPYTQVNINTCAYNTILQLSILIRAHHTFTKQEVLVDETRRKYTTKQSPKINTRDEPEHNQGPSPRTTTTKSKDHPCTWDTSVPSAHQHKHIKHSQTSLILDWLCLLLMKAPINHISKLQKQKMWQSGLRIANVNRIFDQFFYFQHPSSIII